jgi:hypothetical protein
LLIFRLLEEAESGRSRDYVCLKDNVISSLLVTLNDVLHEFRSAQSAYVRQLDSRRQNVDSFLLAPSSSHDPFNVYGNDPSTTDPNEELSIDQIQAIIENEHMVKEREKEVQKTVIWSFFGEHFSKKNFFFQNDSGVFLCEKLIALIEKP